jgi:hypothetical protein
MLQVESTLREVDRYFGRMSPNDLYSKCGNRENSDNAETKNAVMKVNCECTAAQRDDLAK